MGAFHSFYEEVKADFKYAETLLDLALKVGMAGASAVAGSYVVEFTGDKMLAVTVSVGSYALLDSVINIFNKYQRKILPIQWGTTLAGGLLAGYIVKFQAGEDAGMYTELGVMALLYLLHEYWLKKSCYGLAVYNLPVKYLHPDSPHANEKGVRGMKYCLIKKNDDLKRLGCMQVSDQAVQSFSAKQMPDFNIDDVSVFSILFRGASSLQCYDPTLKTSNMSHDKVAVEHEKKCSSDTEYYDRVTDTCKPFKVKPSETHVKDKTITVHGKTEIDHQVINDSTGKAIISHKQHQDTYFGKGALEIVAKKLDEKGAWPGLQFDTSKPLQKGKQYASFTHVTRGSGKDKDTIRNKCGCEFYLPGGPHVDNMKRYSPSNAFDVAWNNTKHNQEHLPPYQLPVFKKEVDHITEMYNMEHENKDYNFWVQTIKGLVHNYKFIHKTQNPSRKDLEDFIKNEVVYSKSRDYFKVGKLQDPTLGGHYEVGLNGETYKVDQSQKIKDANNMVVFRRIEMTMAFEPFNAALANVLNLPKGETAESYVIPNRVWNPKNESCYEIKVDRVSDTKEGLRFGKKFNETKMDKHFEEEYMLTGHKGDYAKFPKYRKTEDGWSEACANVQYLNSDGFPTCSSNAEPSSSVGWMLEQEQGRSNRPATGGIHVDGQNDFSMSDIKKGTPSRRVNL